MESGGTTPRRTALLVGLELPATKRVRGALEPLELELREVADGKAALALAPRRPIHGLVVSTPLPGGPVVRFLQAVREVGSPLRRTGVVLLTPEAHRLDAQSMVGRGVNRVVAVERIEETLPEALDVVMRAARRAPIVTPVRLQLTGTTRLRRTFCRTVNLSTAGMLVRMPHSLPIGADLTFELFLAGLTAPLHGMARVARHTLSDREPFAGIGVEFTDVGTGDRQLISDRVGRNLQ